MKRKKQKEATTSAPVKLIAEGVLQFLCTESGTKKGEESAHCFNVKDAFTTIWGPERRGWFSKARCLTRKKKKAFRGGGSFRGKKDLPQRGGKNLLVRSHSLKGMKGIGRD